MASSTDIANRALQKIGASTIMSITDDTKNALQAKLAYSTLRASELRRHPWSFAMARASLAALDAAPAWGFSLAYELPAECVRVVEIDGAYLWDGSLYRGEPNVPFRVEGRQILTELTAPLNIRYVRDMPDTGAFDPLFVEALACIMAAELAEPLAQSVQKQQLALAQYKDTVREARRANALEGPAQTAADDSWVLGRL